MYLLIGLLGLTTVMEGFLCDRPLLSPSRRKILAGMIIVLMTLATLGLCLKAWTIWLWAVPFTMYRIINLLRIYAARLSKRHLQTVAVRAYGWLVAAETITVITAWLLGRYELAAGFFTVVTVSQLICALVLLRATVHTWRHAQASSATPALGDKELPSLSVLIPARNETVDLEQCLERLVTSDYPKLEILVLDDCSSNRRTPEIIRSYAHSGIRFVPGKLPDETHWLAKNYAYKQLADEASGDILAFCGVDTLLEQQSLRRLVELLLAKKKTMLSVMPLRAHAQAGGNSLLQAMRYYWETCLPRRLFKRPPVLSSCWLIRKETLQQMGGFESVSRSVSPEASLARRAVVTDSYSFIRSDENLGIFSNKSFLEQYATSVRVRYPQLHRRLELMVFVSLFELLFFIGPLIGLLLSSRIRHTLAYVAMWTLTLVCLFVTYGLVSIGTRLTTAWYGWIWLPIATLVDVAILHISMWKYEFSTVEWKGRNVCIPVMQVTDPLPVEHS